MCNCAGAIGRDSAIVMTYLLVYFSLELLGTATKQTLDSSVVCLISSAYKSIAIHVSYTPKC